VRNHRNEKKKSKSQRHWSTAALRGAISIEAKPHQQIDEGAQRGQLHSQKK